MNNRLRDEVKNKINARGYSMADMREVAQRVRNEQHEWKREFDEYIHLMLYDDSDQDLDKLVAKAEKLADIRAIVIARRCIADIEDYT